MAVFFFGALVCLFFVWLTEDVEQGFNVGFCLGLATRRDAQISSFGPHRRQSSPLPGRWVEHLRRLQNRGPVVAPDGIQLPAQGRDARIMSLGHRRRKSSPLPGRRVEHLRRLQRRGPEAPDGIQLSAHGRDAQ